MNQDDKQTGEAFSWELWVLAGTLTDLKMEQSLQKPTRRPCPN